MKIFVVLAKWDYEGDELVACFSTLDKAEAWIKKAEEADHEAHRYYSYHVEGCEVDILE